MDWWRIVTWLSIVLFFVLTGCGGKLPPEAARYLYCVAECSRDCLVSCAAGVPMGIAGEMEEPEPMPPVFVCTEDGECVEVK
jgi:hypothetical protein